MSPSLLEAWFDRKVNDVSRSIECVQLAIVYVVVTSAISYRVRLSRSDNIRHEESRFILNSSSM
jgi:hypothetical protein